MLKLTRKLHEEIVIGKNITIKVLQIKGNVVKLGVIAPKEVVVNREEVHEMKKEGKKA